MTHYFQGNDYGCNWYDRHYWVWCLWFTWPGGIRYLNVSHEPD